MDEPFSNLDVELRRKLSAEVRDLLKQKGISALMVTHDQEEAFAMADRIGVINEHCMQQWDSPFNLYHEPSNPFIANFVGQGSFIAGTALSSDCVKTVLGEFQGNRAYQWEKGTPIKLLIRPDDVLPDEEHGHRAQIIGKTFGGASTLYNLRLNSGEIIKSWWPSHFDYNEGDNVGVKIEFDHLVAFSQSDA